MNLRKHLTEFLIPIEPLFTKKTTVSVIVPIKSLFCIDQIARDARPAFGGPWPSVNLMTHLHAQGVNSRLHNGYECLSLHK